MIRDFRAPDTDAVLELNRDNEPEVSHLAPAKLAWLAAESPYFKVVEVDSRPVGFLIGMTDAQSDYVSPNFRWFQQRHQSFAYVDRIALSESARGLRWGPRLYTGFEQWAVTNGRPVLCAEVNSDPPNPRSLRFHQLAGFEEVGRTKPFGPELEEAMFEKRIG